MRKKIFEEEMNGGLGKRKVEVYFTENEYTSQKQNKVKYPGLNIFFTLLPREKIFCFFPPSYKLIKAIIQGLAEIHGKEEVERELGIRILGGDKDERNKMD